MQKQFKSRFFSAVCAFAALCMASCSQDDALQTSVNDNDGSVPVTLSATIDHGVQTRATSTTDDDATRCLLQIIEDDGTTTTKRDVQAMDLGADGSYTATAMLNPYRTYNFLFWADGGDTYYTATNLEAVTIAGEASEAGIAWYGSASWNSSESTEIKATLTHAVTKVTLQSTTAVPTETTAEISGVKEYSTFNVLDGTVTGETTTYTHSGDGSGQEGDVFSFYALVDGDTQNLTLQTGDQPAVPIPNVPLAQNKHVILSGDVANAGLTEYTFTATLDENWASSTTEGFPKIYLEGGETLTEPGDYIVTGSVTETITLSGEGINLTLKDANISVSSGNGINITDGNPTIHVVGENNSVTSNDGAGIYVAAGSTVTITGDSRDNVLTTQAGGDAAGIGGCYNNQDCGSINISNVTVIARGNQNIAVSPGIGSTSINQCGQITIDNATVHAYGEGISNTAECPAIGTGIANSLAYGTTLPTVIIRNESEIHVHRGGSSADYIGYPFVLYSTGAASAINPGVGGSITGSTIYCYTGNSDTPDKTIVYDANGSGVEQSQ